MKPKHRRTPDVHPSDLREAFRRGLTRWLDSKTGNWVAAIGNVENLAFQDDHLQNNWQALTARQRAAHIVGQLANSTYSLEERIASELTELAHLYAPGRPPITKYGQAARFVRPRLELEGDEQKIVKQAFLRLRPHLQTFSEFIQQHATTAPDGRITLQAIPGVTGLCPWCFERDLIVVMRRDATDPQQLICDDRHTLRIRPLS